MAGAESMPSIKQEALCCLKSARSLGEFIVNPSSWGADGGRWEVSGRGDGGDYIAGYLLETKWKGEEKHLSSR